MSAVRPTVTMKMIAHAAGVSQSTVSRVLNGVEARVPIAPETRERVLGVARHFGYRPNPLARGLRGSGTTLLGLIVREVADPFFSSVVQAITEASSREGYNIVLGNAGSSADEALTVKAVLETRHCDAILLLGDLRDAPRLLTELKGANLPLVGLCQGSRLRGIPTINADNRLGVYLALEYLRRLGHQRISFVDGGWGGDIQERRQAYFDFMAGHGLEVPKGYHQVASSDLEGGRVACRSLLALPAAPSAVLASNDAMAIGVMKGASEAGVGVPKTLSVVGFDDIPFSRFAIPSLTTVRQPVREMAHLALREALRLIGNADGGADPVRLLVPELVVRDSCRSPPATA